MKGVVALALAGSAMLTGVPAQPGTGPGAGGGLGTTRAAVGAIGDTFDLWNDWAQAADRPNSTSASASQIEVETRQALTCLDGNLSAVPAHESGWCESGSPPTALLDCADDAVPPTWRRTRPAGGQWSAWERLSLGSCGPVLPVLTVEDFRSLPLPAPTLRLQPDGGWVLVNIDTIVMTDATTVPLRTTLAGFGVDVEAAPQLFTYDFGDGHSRRTTSPGRPYPGHDTSHAYEAPGTYTVTLTPTWSGRYRVDGDPTWREVTGTATTATTSAPFEAQERTSRLVSELCSATPAPADC